MDPLAKASVDAVVEETMGTGVVEETVGTGVVEETVGASASLIASLVILLPPSLLALSVRPVGPVEASLPNCEEIGSPGAWTTFFCALRCRGSSGRSGEVLGWRQVPAGISVRQENVK